MSGFALVMMLGIVLGLEFFLPLRPITYQDRVETQAEAYARNLGVYEEAAKSYVRTHLGATGALDDAGISANYPTGYAKMEAWIAYRNASGQILVTVVGAMKTTIPTNQIARSLQELEGNPMGIGVVKSNQIVSAQGLPVDLASTGWVLPDGSIAVLTAQK